MIRNTVPGDRASLLKLIQDSGQFDPDGLAYVAAKLDGHFRAQDEALWLTAADGEPVGFAYCAPEPVTSGTWNLLMLWVREDRRSQGLGRLLVAEVEERLRERRGRLFLVETSGLPEFEAAQAFYTRCGFTHEATIKHFFAAGDHKLIFTKSLELSQALP